MCPMFGDIKYEMTWHAFLGHPMAQPKWQRPKRLREDPETECLPASGYTQHRLWREKGSRDVGRGKMAHYAQKVGDLSAVQ